jgi:hypothetical protein
MVLGEKHMLSNTETVTTVYIRFSASEACGAVANMKYEFSGAASFGETWATGRRHSACCRTSAEGYSTVLKTGGYIL